MKEQPDITEEQLKTSTAPQPYSKWDCCYTTILFGTAITSLILAFISSYSEDQSRGMPR